MKVNWKKVGQYILFCVLFGIGFFAFMIVAGDDDPSNPLPIGRWMAIKSAAMAVLVACVFTGKYLNKLGLFSEIDFDEDEDDENI